MLMGNKVIQTVLKQKGVGFWSTPILVKISFEKDVGGLIVVEPWNTWIFYTLNLLKIETSWAPHTCADGHPRSLARAGQCGEQYIRHVIQRDG